LNMIFSINKTTFIREPNKHGVVLLYYS
jgi:hypothetical protein